MDQFVVIKSTQENLKIPGRSAIVKSLKEIVDLKHTICVYGKPGVGKTYIVKRVLGEGYLELDYTILKSRTHTQEFLERVRETNSNILIDDFDIDLPGSKEISQKPLSRGATIIVCDNIQKLGDLADCIEIPAFTEDEINLLWPGHPRAARLCQGNLHNFEFYKQFSHTKDVFKSSREWIEELLTTPRDSYIKESLDEHGNSLSIIHENYIVCGKNLCEIAECLSQADVYDTEIYKSKWEYMDYFQIVGIAEPCYHIGGSLRDHLPLRPGSCWTKHNNMKMRHSKIKKFRMGVDTLVYLLEFVKLNPVLSLCYDIQPADIDVLNHLKLSKKFKSSEIQALKKHISALYRQNV